MDADADQASSTPSNSNSRRGKLNKSVLGAGPLGNRCLARKVPGTAVVGGSLSDLPIKSFGTHGVRLCEASARREPVVGEHGTV